MNSPTYRATTVPPRATLIAAALAAGPILVLAAMTWLGPASGHGFDWVASTLAWGAVLLGVMGGMRFGYALKAFDGQSDLATLGAGLMPGAAGIGSLLVQPLAGAAVQLAMFLLVSLWDITSAQAGRLPDWVVRVRIGMTAAAVIALLATLGAVIFLPPV